MIPRSWWLLAITTSLCAGAAIHSGNQTGGSKFSPYVDASGDITLPTGYRDKWTHMGTWVVPWKHAPGYGFHDVYASPGSVPYYKKNGKFPDGAVIIKEIREVESAGMTSGDAHWAGKMRTWFVMIKDDKNRFPTNKLWGHGWGWSSWLAGMTQTNLVDDYEIDCLTCHKPAEKTDWVYTSGYPTLRAK